jgi:steroid delta-isomerase-like uncharacterized protein
MSTDQDKALIRQFLDGAIDNVQAVMATNVVWHGPSPIGTVIGLEALRQQVGGVLYTAFPDLQTSVHDLFAEGNRVVARWTDHGTHRGNLLGCVPTGQAVSYSGISIYRVEQHKIAEGWVQWDMLGLLQQLRGASHGNGDDRQTG